MFEHQQIVNLLNEYAYTLDVCMVDPEASQQWAALFVNDCNITYPFGTHIGTKGLADWCLNAETRFQRMMVSIFLVIQNHVEPLDSPNLFPSPSKQRDRDGSH